MEHKCEKKKCLRVIIAVATIVFMFNTTMSLADVRYQSVESYTIHSGTYFGMTHEMVEKAEDSAGFDFSFVPAGSITDFDYGYVKGKIAGIEDSTVFYHFVDNKLIGVEYKFIEDAMGYTYKKTARANYDYVQTALEKKYGAPDACRKYLSASTVLIFPMVYKNINYEYMFEKNGRVLEDYAQWVVNLNDGAVITISHVINAKDDKYYHHRLYYVYYNAEDAATIRFNHNIEVEQMMDDI